MSAALRRSVDSLSVPNYRRYFVGQVVSLSGNWMQMVAEIWLILSLTGSGLAVGMTTALQFLPILLFGAWGGLLADRFPKRRLLMVTQALMVIPALGLLTVTAAGVVAPWMVLALVFARGTINSVDNPTRQSFAIEMVGADRVVNAVSLNSVLIQSARLVGPALAGILIVSVGVEPCFAINALSFGVMIFALWRMEPDQLNSAPRAEREPGAIRAAVRYVRATPELAVPLALMALVGTFGLNFQVILPLLARFSFEGGADRLRGPRRRDGRRLGRRRARDGGPRPHRSPVDRRRRALASGSSRRSPRRCRASPSSCRRWRCSAPPRSPSPQRSTHRCSSRSSRRCGAG